VPEDLNSTLQEYTEQGYRVIALGRRALAETSYSKIQRMHRDDMEQDLEFLGMIVLENRLKLETEPVIGVLKGAHLKIVMITGAKHKFITILRPPSPVALHCVFHADSANCEHITACFGRVYPSASFTSGTTEFV
jgi:hypothetical protein